MLSASEDLLEGPKWCNHADTAGLGPTCRCDHWSCFADATRFISEHGTSLHFCDDHDRSGGMP